MRKLLILIICSFFCCNVFGQSQKILNDIAEKEFIKSDKEMNLVYQNLLVEYKNDSVFVRCTKEAQRAWIKFRDLQIKMKYPTGNSSSQPMCRFYYMAELTNNRTIELNKWLIKVEEGDVCAGSIHFE